MKFAPFDTFNYKSIANKEIGSLADVKKILTTEITSGLTKNGKTSHGIMMGTDSQVKGIYTHFVTIIVLNRIGKGARGFYARYRIPNFNTITEKLFAESSRTLELAFELNDIFEQFSIIPIIHADVNPDTRFKSSKIIKEVIGMIEAQGFNYVTKPNAWVSTHVCDHLVKMQ